MFRCPVALLPCGPVALRPCSSVPNCHLCQVLYLSMLPPHQVLYPSDAFDTVLALAARQPVGERATNQAHRG